MPLPALDAHVRLVLHPEHTSAVTATITGSGSHLARAVLAGHGFRWIDGQTMVLARIDHEEPHYADKATRALRQEGAVVEIDAALQDEISTEWTWADYPMPWLSRDEIRGVGAEAQKIHDDIVSGSLTIRLHAHDGWTTVAVGTYNDGKSIHLHGEDRLRQVSLVYDDESEALAEFQRLHTVAVRPGPAPLTSTERSAVSALATARPKELVPAPAPSTEPAPAKPETVPVYAADPGDHEALLEDFLESQGEWEKVRTWCDNTTIASHESLALRAEFTHEADPQDTVWTIAAYESPVGDRLWHATATAATPVEIMRTFLDSITAQDAWGAGPGARVTEKTIAEVARPLADAGWTQSMDGRWISWAAPNNDAAGVQFDALAQAHPGSPLPAWTMWGGNSVDRPTWAVRLSSYAPATLLQDLTFELAEGQCVRQAEPDPPMSPRLTAQPGPRSLPPAPTASAPGMRR